MKDRLGVISDEISEHFTVALDWLVQHDLKYVEIRMVNGKNISSLTNEELDACVHEVRSRGLKVSALASPLFKCPLNPDRSVASGDKFGQADAGVEEHLQLLERLLYLASRLETNHIRVFSFWREREPESYFDEIASYLLLAANRAGKESVTLLLENEDSCNGGSAREVAEIVRRVDSPWLKIVWDPGNEVFTGNRPFPEGYTEVRPWMAHVHLKDARINEEGKVCAVPIGQGVVPWREHFQQLQQDGYTGLYIIETHYKPHGGTAMEGTKLTLEGLQNIAGQQ